MLPTVEQVKAARTKLWLRGNLSWKLDVTQKKLYEFYKNNTNKIIVWNASRRLGKTHTLLILAIELCIKNKNTIVKYVTPSQKMARSISKQSMRQILLDCPTEVMPQFRTNDNIFVFPNGSEIQLAGTDSGNHEKIRGGSAQLCIVDEAGFCDDLGYVVRSVLMPTTQTTNGRILLSSTPSKTPDHEFTTFMEQAEIDGSLMTKTIYDAIEDNKSDPRPGISLEEVELVKAQYPGREKNTEFQREFLCKIIIEGQSAIFPEFTECEKDIVVAWPRPPCYDAYVSMDIGFKDLTVVLFGYFDFRNNMTVIEDEIVMNGPEMTTDKLANAIRLKESNLWFEPLTNEIIKPYLRISDNNLIVINDLRQLHGITFMPTQKDDKAAAVNKLRMMIESKQLAINPKCKTLIAHMRHGTWDKTRTNFSRSKSDGAHYDAADAMLYMIRNINYNKNPYPNGYGMNYGYDTFYSKVNKGVPNKNVEQLNKLFPKPRKLSRFSKD